MQAQQGPPGVPLPLCGQNRTPSHRGCTLKALRKRIQGMCQRAPTYPPATAAHQSHALKEASSLVQQGAWSKQKPCSHFSKRRQRAWQRHHEQCSLGQGTRRAGPADLRRLHDGAPLLAGQLRIVFSQDAKHAVCAAQAAPVSAGQALQHTDQAQPHPSRRAAARHRCTSRLLQTETLKT